VAVFRLGRMTFC